MIEQTEQDWNKLPESLREKLALAVRPNWGMFFDPEWDEKINDLQVIEDAVFASVVFRWLVGNEL